MSTKHNCPHPERGRSHYRDRLARRGLSKSPVMGSLEHLQGRQERRVQETCTRGTDHARHECDGFPWWAGRESAEEENAA